MMVRMRIMRRDLSSVNRYAAFYLYLLSGCVSRSHSCATLSADSRLVGTYVGANSESLNFLSDARVYYNRIVEGQKRNVLLGYAAAPSSSPPGSLFIIGPDTSPYIGTFFQLSDDFRTVAVHWRNLRNPKDTSSQTQFHKNGILIPP